MPNTETGTPANGSIVNVGVPGNIKQVVLETGRSYTVADILCRAGLSADGYELRLAGDPANPTTAVTAGQTVLLLRPVRGNADVVNVGVPGNIKQVVLEPGRANTVGDVICRAGLTTDGYELRVAGDPAAATTPVEAGQTVLLLRPVRGN